MDVKERDLRLWGGYKQLRILSSSGLCEQGKETVR
jgi:hypothetical protein